MSELGLNDHHHATTLNYLRFTRYQRGQRLKAVDLCFKELKDTRLTDDTFTIDEVKELLGALQDAIEGEVETEFIHSAHTNVLMLRQLFQQAEKWHLKMSADISELENRELLEKIKLFEEKQFAGIKDKDLLTMTKLQPVNEGGGAALLQREIERLGRENEKLRKQLGIASASGDTEALQQELEQTKALLAKETKRGSSDADLVTLQHKMAALQATLESTKESSKAQEEKLFVELSDTKHELLKVNEMLDLAEKELEKKVSQTAPFKNLQQMLQKKNDQVKQLRSRLGKYEKTDD